MAYVHPPQCTTFAAVDGRQSFAAFGWTKAPGDWRSPKARAHHLLRLNFVPASLTAAVLSRFRPALARRRSYNVGVIAGFTCGAPRSHTRRSAFTSDITFSRVHSPMRQIWIQLRCRR